MARASTLAERELISLVQRGEWHIDADGRIWRSCVRTGLKNGGSVLAPVPPRRVEKQLPQGYLMVRAVMKGRRVHGLAHRLIWQHFHGDIAPGHEVNHRNGIKDDNRPSNLMVTTPSENSSHAHRHRLQDQRGQRNPAAKLTDNQVAQIRLAYDQGGYTMEQLAVRFKVSVQHVSKLVRGHRRAVQGGPVRESDLRHFAGERDPATGRFAGRLLDGVTHDGFPQVRA